MSFILDALKKSEIERQRQSMPGLVDAGAIRPRPRLPLWAIALALLLAVNLAVLLYVLGRGGATRPLAAAETTQGTAHIDASPRGASSTPPSDTSSAPRPGAENAAGAPGGQPDTHPGSAAAHFSPLDGAPEFAPEIPVEQAEQVEPADAPKSSAHHREAKPHDDEPPDEVLPSISEVSLSGGQALPDLHLDVHVFATQPTDRFVYINMRKYREGSTLEEGPTLERIRRDGVVLNYQGVRFLLPRQQ